MTNEKTIEILKELWRYSNTDKYSESEIREAIKIAIKAVESVDYDCADCKWYLEVKKNEMSKEDRKVADGDLVSRKSVITMLQKIENAIEDGDGFQFNEWIEYAKDIPSAEKMARWIPVSERLPEKGEYGKVLVTYIPSGGTLWTTVMIAYYSDLMGIAKPCFHIGEVGKKSYQNITKQVTAWMPLPKPYKAESEDKE